MPERQRAFSETTKHDFFRASNADAVCKKWKQGNNSGKLDGDRY